MTTTTIDKRQLLGMRWQLDPDSSEVGFRVPNYWGLTKVTGTFGSVRGTLDLSDPERPSIDLRIDAGSVDTGNRRRDEHLRSADFFDAEHGPELRFVAHDVEFSKAGDTLEIRGELHARGRALPLSLTATVAASDDEVRVRAATEIDQRELGITHSPLGMIRTPTTLFIDARVRVEDPS